MARYRWIFPDKGTVTVIASNKIEAKKKIIKSLGKVPKSGRLVKL